MSIWFKEIITSSEKETRWNNWPQIVKGMGEAPKNPCMPWITNLISLCISPHNSDVSIKSLITHERPWGRETVFSRHIFAFGAGTKADKDVDEEIVWTRFLTDYRALGKFIYLFIFDQVRQRELENRDNYCFSSCSNFKRPGFRPIKQQPR